MGSPPQVAKNGPFPNQIYTIFISGEAGCILLFLAFWAFISFHFGVLGIHFLSFWPFGASFPFILAFWGFISFHFGLLGIHFLSFWPFGASFPFILAFWAFISFHFGLLKLHFLSFWSFGASYSFILGFWAFICFHFGLLGLHFLSFWPSGPSFPLSNFNLLGPFPLILRLPRGVSPTIGLSFPFILAFWAFICFHFGFLGLHFLSFWPYGLRFLLLGLHFLSFWGCHVGPPPQVATHKRSVS